MAASPTVRADLTPDDAVVLCVLCTGTATGARLVGSVNLRMNSTLADVRSILTSLARGGDGGKAAVSEDPTNVTEVQAERILSAPLHPFDFNMPFCFVHSGGNRAYRVEQEHRRDVKSVLPRYPRLGVPAATEWVLQPPAPTVVVPFIAAGASPTPQRERRRGRALASSSSSASPATRQPTPSTLTSRGAAAFTAAQKRLALCVLYVAQGSGQEGMHLERVLEERLLLQQTTPTLSSLSLPLGSYGRGHELQQWCSSITRWNVHVPDFMGRTILQETALAGNTAVVRYLTAQPFVPLNEADQQGNTALHLAVRAGQAACVQLLLEAGADALQANREGNTPLHVALLGRKAPLVGLLGSRLRATGVDASTTLRDKRNREGLSPVDLFERLSPTFLELCRDGSLLAVQSLMNHYLFDRAHLAEREGGTLHSCLHAAAVNSVHPDVLPYLITELGALHFPAKRWRDLLDARLQTPLHIAAARGCVANAQALLAAYPSFLAHQDINGDTPLMTALKHRRVAVAEVLLTHSAPGAVAANACDHRGMTALHFACGLGLRHVAEALITQHGANVVSSAQANLLLRDSSPESNSMEGKMWDSAKGDRNVMLVPASVRPEILAVGLRMQRAASERRRRCRDGAAKRAVASSSSSLDASSPLLLSHQFGGGMRSSTPLLCALVHAHRQLERFERGSTPERALALLDVILRHGGVATADDARDALVFLLTHDCVSLADRILSLDSGDSGGVSACVHEVRRDNRLLCRLCERVCTDQRGGAQAHSIDPLRWCVDRRCCAGVNTGNSGLPTDPRRYPTSLAEEGYARDCGLPLMTCARVGNAAAARFLLEAADADPNVLASAGEGTTPLLAAIHGGHDEVAGLLVRAGARVSSLDGSWSALTAAAVRGQTAVVCGLLGLEALSPFDVPRALLEVLLADANAAEADGARQREGWENGKRRRSCRRGDGPAVRRQRRERICEALAAKVDPTACAPIHPVELIHLSASRGLFTTTRALAERMLALPRSVMQEMVLSAPAPPSECPTTLIEPTMVPVEGHSWKRLLPNPVTGKGGLHRPPLPFRRLVVPNYRAARVHGELPHRLVRRDAFSYCAEAVELSALLPWRGGAASSLCADAIVELVQTLRHDVGLLPWTVVDVRGRTPADYAVRAGCKVLLCLFTASGIAPRSRHDALAVEGKGRVRRKVGSSPLARAVYHSSRYHGNAPMLTVAVMCRLVVENLSKEAVFDAYRSLRDLVEEQCRWYGVHDLRQVGSSMDAVVRACAAANRLDVLTMLTEDYRLPLSRSSSPLAAPSPTPLLIAVVEGNMPLLTFLLHAGCDAHEAALPRRDMVPYIKVKRAEEKRITPLCLAAWMGKYEVIHLLTSAAPFEEGYFRDAGRTGTSAGPEILCDALLALICASPRGLPEEQERLVAAAVHHLAGAGHPFLSPLVLRECAAKRLVHATAAVIECYGPQTFLADITDGGSLRQVNSLHHFAAHPALCGMLRSMLVMTESDEYGVSSRKPTDVARAVVRLCSGARDDDDDDDGGGGRKGSDEPMAMSPVDWALCHNCVEGAILLLSIGLLGTGTTQCLGRPTTLFTQTQSVLRHYHRVHRTRRYVRGSFTVLHSAVALGFDAVINALASEVKTLLPVSDVVLGPGMRAAVAVALGEARVREEGEGGGGGGGGARVAPSLYSLAARDAAGWHRWIRPLEDVVRGEVPFSASDSFAVLFGGLGVTRTLDAILRMPCNAGVLTASFTLQDPDVDSAVLAKQLLLLRRRRPPGQRSFGGGGGGGACQPSLFVDGGRAMLTGFTPLTCAIAAGSLEWVQYFTSANPSAIAYHRATATQVCYPRDRRGAAARGPGEEKEKRKDSSRWDGRRREKGYPRHLRHHCSLATHDGLFVSLTSQSTAMDAVVLSAALLADAVASGDAARIAQHSQIFDFLARVPGAIGAQNVNSVAMTAVALRRWSMLETVMEQAVHMREAGAGERFFVMLMAEEIPVALRRVLGAARHVMHLAARNAPQDVIIRIAQHSSRSDIESGFDGEGRSSLFHALHHRSNPVATLETFASLRIPMGPPCCRKRERTALMVAASRGSVELVSRLVKPERVHQQDRHGHTALMLAAAHGHLAVVELLLASNADGRVQNQAGMTAAMLAALGGHDDVAASLARNHSRVKDFSNPKTSLLHCAAVGGCWRTAEVVCKAFLDGGGFPAASLLQEDRDGHTALYLAHCFGSARVLRTVIATYYEGRRSTSVASDAPGHPAKHKGNHESGVDARARMLLTLDAAPSSSAGAASPVTATTLGDREKRILRCDSSLPTFGWLRGVLGINETLVKEALKSMPPPGSPQRGRAAWHWEDEGPLRPGERAIAPQLPPFRRVGAAKPFQGNLLRWCAVTNNAVGIRVLADMNVADDCGALPVAARLGHMDAVKLLVSLDMSDASTAEEERGHFPFETAAMAGHTACASYLLRQTRVDVVAAAALSAPASSLLLQEAHRGTGGGGDDGHRAAREGGDPSADSFHGMLHRLAPVCGGTILVQVVEHLLKSSNKVAILCERLWTLLQRPDKAGLTPFEYAIAMGDPCAVLRCAQLLQQLAEEASRAHSSTGTASVDMGSVTIARALLDYLPNLSPAVRALLFDVFAVEGVSHAIGFDADPGGAAAIADGGKQKGREAHTTTPDNKRNAEVLNGSAPPTAVAVALADEAVPRKSHRLTFADVRLLGINALTRDAYCQSLVHSVYTIDHERLALRHLMKAFPFRIRYEPESFGCRPLAQQKQLLQWLSTSLVLASYDGATHGDIETIEVKIAPYRSDELYTVRGAESGALSHSLYVSSSCCLVGPDVHAALKSTRETYRSEARRSLEGLCRRATRAMRALPHPALREGSVTLDWHMGVVGAHRGSAGAVQDVWADRAMWDSVVRRVRSALESIVYYFQVNMAELMRDVTEEDLIAVVGEVRQPKPAAVSLRYAAASAAALPAVVRFPPPSQLRGGDGGGGAESMDCCLRFDSLTITDAAYALENTVRQAVAGDVALVRVHYMRDRFLRRLRAAGTVSAVGVDDTAGADPQRRDTGRSLVAVVASASPSSSSSPAAANASLSQVTFKLELESSALAAIPMSLMSTMLDDAADVVARLLSGRPSGSPPRSSPTHVGRFHSASIIAEALRRGLRSVLVLFSSKREPLVKYSGGKLMLCFAPHLAPRASDIDAEIRGGILKEETALCRRLLTDIVATLAQRVQSYLPSVRLVVDLAAIDSPQEDREAVLSTLRLLTYKHSALVLEPFVEGVCVGWDGPVGACVRQSVKQLTLTLETRERGSCYVTPRGNCIYYCPLQCVQRGGGHGVKGSPPTLSAWQLLTAQQVASLVLLQLAVHHPEIPSLVDGRKSAACWTQVWRDGTRPVVAGGHGYAYIQLRSMLNRAIRQPEAEEQFRLVGEVSKVKVRDLGQGRYRVRYTAPRRSGYTRLWFFLHGQQLFHSPLYLRVHPAEVSLERTITLSKYDAVVVHRPFDVLLRLTDSFGNRLERRPDDLTVRLPSGGDAGVTLLGWGVKGTDVLAVRLKVDRAKAEVFIPLLLSCTVAAAHPRHGLPQDGTAAPPPRETQTFTDTFVFQSVSARTYERIMTLRKGVVLDAASGKGPANHTKLFFRRSIREAERARLRREADAIGPAFRRRFAPSEKKSVAPKTEKGRAPGLG